jgi:RND family efflux transporter MFP subunit
MSKHAVTIVLRGLISIAILIGGFGLAVMLFRSRKPAPQVNIPEHALRVDVVSATFKDVPVEIFGLGEVRSRDVVRIAPEIPGRIVNIHPKLEIGGIIPAGEILFEIDPRDFQARYDQSKASVSQLRNTIERLKKQYAIDQERLKTFKSTRTLAKAEYNRVKHLYERDKVGTQSRVDNSEMAYNSANDAYAQLSQSVDLFPIRINEAEDGLASSEAMARLSKTNLERTKVSVPFDARVKTVTLEQGQYVSTGMPVLTLANDSILEISVSLDSKLASTWLDFEKAGDASNTAWFGNLTQVPVRINWRDDAEWIGTLHRIEKFDQETRTINVVVRIAAQNALNPTEGEQSLVEGMFCRIIIPGKTAEHVVELPIECVSFAKDSEGYQTVFLAKESPDDGKLRLAKVKVLESHKTKQSIYISDGLREGDRIVTTRLINPLANSLLNTDGFESMETD